MPTLSVSPCPFTPKHTCPSPCQSHPVPSHPNTHALYHVSLTLSLHTQTHMPFTMSVSPCPFTPKHTCPLPCQSHCVPSYPNTHALYLHDLSVSPCPFTPKHTCPLPCQSHPVPSHPNTHALYHVSLTLSLHTQTHMPFTLSVSLCPFIPKHTCPLPAWLVSLTLSLHTQTHMPFTLSVSLCPFTPKHTCPLPAWLVSLTLSLHTQTHMPFTCMTCQSHPVPSHPNTHALYLHDLSVSPCPFTPKHTCPLPAWLVSLTLSLHTQTHLPLPARSCPVWGWWLLPGSSTFPCCRAGWRWGWWSGDRWPPCRRSADPRECRSCGSRKSGTCCRWRTGVWGWSWWPCLQDDEGQRSRCKRSILNWVRKQCQLLTHVMFCPVFLINSFIFCLPVGLFQHWNQTQWHCSSAICYSSPAQFQNCTANLQLNWHAIRLISQIWLKK